MVFSILCISHSPEWEGIQHASQLIVHIAYGVEGNIPHASQLIVYTAYPIWNGSIIFYMLVSSLHILHILYEMEDNISHFSQLIVYTVQSALCILPVCLPRPEMDSERPCPLWWISANTIRRAPSMVEWLDFSVSDLFRSWTPNLVWNERVIFHTLVS